MERRRFNTPGDPYRPAESRLEEWERGRLAHQPRSLDLDDRELVLTALRDVSLRRGWRLEAVAVRTEHVHVVLGADGPPEPVLIALKAAATRALRLAGRAAADDHVWARHGSPRYLWDEQAVLDATRYVLEGQDQPNSNPTGREGVAQFRTPSA